MHIGGMRTALFNWLWARHTGGKFILRIDDTDRQRNVEEALRPILAAFRWLDLAWDEGPEVGGPHGPYFQSQRGEIYQRAANQLLEAKKAYRDFETPTEVQSQREAADREKRPFISSRRSLELSEAEIERLVAESRPHVIRFLIPRGTAVALDDVVRGHVEWDTSLIVDPVIMRGDGTPLYNFATVVDDAAMEITHVIRAEEHLSNTPQQILMHQALGHTLPVFAHIPFVTAPGTTKKLSKREIKKYRENPKFRKMFEDADRVFPQIGLGNSETLNPVMVEYYEKIGFLPHAVFNSLARIGWSLDDRTEFMSRVTSVENFTLERIVKNPAGLDPDKLYSFQTHWMGQLSLEEKVGRVLPYLIEAKLIPLALDAAAREYVARVVQTLGERLKVSSDILEARDFFVSDDRLVYDDAALEKRMAPEGTLDRLQRFLERLTSVEPFAPGPIEEAFRAFVDSEKIKPAELIHALRLTATAKATGPGLFECLALLGKERSQNRISTVLNRLYLKRISESQQTQEEIRIRETHNE
jgi:glutamyl-tRNA synthetase